MDRRTFLAAPAALIPAARLVASPLPPADAGWWPVALNPTAVDGYVAVGGWRFFWLKDGVTVRAYYHRPGTPPALVFAHAWPKAKPRLDSEFVWTYAFGLPGPRGVVPMTAAAADRLAGVAYHVAAGCSNRMPAGRMFRPPFAGPVAADTRFGRVVNCFLTRPAAVPAGGCAAGRCPAPPVPLHQALRDACYSQPSCGRFRQSDRGSSSDEAEARKE
jgi:hypothetical protein